MHLPAGLRAGFGKGFQESPPVLVIGVDGLPPVAMVHDVTDGAGILDSQLQTHTS